MVSWVGSVIELHQFLRIFLLSKSICQIESENLNSLTTLVARFDCSRPWCYKISFLTCWCVPICTYTTNKMLLIKEFRIGLVMGKEVCCIGPRPKAVGQYSRSRTRNWASTKLLD